VLLGINSAVVFEKVTREAFTQSGGEGEVYQRASEISPSSCGQNRRRRRHRRRAMLRAEVY
jgi:hypothetical protein